MVRQLPSGRCNSYVDGLPLAVSTYASTITLRHDQGKRMRRAACAAIAQTTEDPVLRHWADSDLLWEDIRSIESTGDQEVWDISLPGVDSFIANGVLAHNSGPK
jgi:intein/homing endonuclease